MDDGGIGKGSRAVALRSFGAVQSLPLGAAYDVLDPIAAAAGGTRAHGDRPRRRGDRIGCRL